MNENDSDVAELGAEVKGYDVSFVLLFGLAVLLIAGLWIGGHNPRWEWFGLLTKVMTIVYGVGFAVIGCLLFFNPRAVRWIARLSGNARRLGIVYLCMSAGFLSFGFFRLFN